MSSSTAAAAASSAQPTPTAPANAGAEPGLSELASIIGAPAAPAAKAKAPNKPAPAKKPAASAATEDHDPEFDGAEDEQDGDPTAGADPENEDLDAGDGDEAEESDDAGESAGEEAGEEQPENTADDAEEGAEEGEGDEAEEGEEDEGELPEGLDADDAKTRKALPPAAQKAFDKAIGKKVRQIRERDQQIQTLQAELTEAKANPPAPIEATPENPLAGVTDEAALDKRLAEFRNLRKWALTHPDGGTVKVGDKDVEVSRERVAQILVETEEMLQEHGPKRRQWLEQDRQLTAKARESYPWLGQKNTPGHLAVENMLRQFGHVPLREIPGIRGDLADLFVGQMIRLQQQQQKGAGKPGAATVAGGKKATVVPKAPATPAGGARPPKVGGAVKQAGTASKTLEETGDDPGNAALGSLIGTRPRRN